MSVLKFSRRIAGRALRQMILCVPSVRHAYRQRDQLLADLEQLQTQRDQLLAERDGRVSGDPLLQGSVLELLSHFTPCQAIGFDKVKLGKAGDGGYVMLEDFKGITTVLSLGIGPDCSWDLDVARRGIDVHMFDHTIDAPPLSHPLFHFHKKMIGTTSTGESASLEDILTTLVKPGDRSILKMDIEGSEWDVFNSISVEGLARFSQIICEFHNFSCAMDPIWREEASRSLTKLSSIFRVVHVHGNNCARMEIIANVPFPDVIEVTFANRSMYQFNETPDIFPTRLDHPNYDRRPDLFLGSLRFR